MLAVIAVAAINVAAPVVLLALLFGVALVHDLALVLLARVRRS